MHLQSYFILCLAFFSIIACGPKSAQEISGTITDASDLNIYFDKMTATGNARVLTNTKANSKGAFNLAFEKPLDDGIYRVRIGAKSVFLRLSPTDSDVNISGSLASLSDRSYEISGSTQSNDLQSSLQKIANARRNKIDLDKYIEEGEDPLTNVFLANQVYKANISKAKVYKSVALQVQNKYPESEYSTEMKGIVASMEKQIKAQKGKYRFEVGDEAPEIVGQSPTGKTKKLSDLKGKVVLIDFWASWCGPCRKANPHVVEVYDKYNKDGFEVFSFSLDGIHPRQLPKMNNDPVKIKQAEDQAKKRWIAAIAKDNLKWDAHASELAHWNSKANKEYGVSSIPTTFLVGRDGTFAAINPRYNLEEAVKAAL